MSTNTIENIKQEDVLLLNRLTKLLEEQVNIIQCSGVSGRKVEALVEQIQSIVSQVAAKGLLDMEQFKDKQEHIKRLYDNLNLAVIAKRNDTQNQLNHINKGKKTLLTYRNNISVENRALVGGLEWDKY
ncbi:MAG: hypothetical protein JXA96_13440 [Sedimentisphaerales bacterium]|nr:hypothetical protein [Sedimentisphaerales bacterium]